VSTAAGFLAAGAVTPQLAASDEGSLIYIPAGGGPAQRLAWLTPAGQEQSAVSVEGTFEGLALSPDGRRVAVALRQDQAASDTLLGIDVWVVDLTTGAKTRLTTTGRSIRPSWSPDGTRVRFVLQQSGLAERSADATTPARVVVSDSVLPYGAIAEGFSVPGNRFILRNYPRSTSRDIVLYDPAARDSTIRGLATTPATETNPRLSPDGHWLAYASSESGRQEVYVVPFPLGGARTAVTTEGASWPRWSADGRTLYYFTSEGALMMASVRTAPAFVVERRQPHPSNFTNAPGVDQFYDVAGDGRILVTRDASPAPRFVLVRNWFSELPR
jgi:eukaryotic-like serine/threonine-protein kinase